MSSRRHQKGYVYRKADRWYLRYYDHVSAEGGTTKLVLKCRSLVPYGGKYRSKKAVQVLADEILAPINNGTVTPHSTMSMLDFVNSVYLPYVKSDKRPSTYGGYKNMWTRYVEPFGEIALRDFRTVHGERLLKAIVLEHDVCKTTLAHIKAFLSGAFRYAKRQGVLNSENPMRDVVLPKAREAGETYAYSIEEILKMLEILDELSATVVATAAFTGCREGEIRGALWENFTGDELRVTQSIWRQHVLPPKTRKSTAPVPVIPRLAAYLDAHRVRCGNPSSGLIFRNDNGRPLNLDTLAAKVIRPMFLKAGLQWHGWHAFRRGLATNLHRLGVPDKTIQRILRHANVAVTQSCYIKTVESDTAEAMMTIEHATNKHLETMQSASNQPQ